MSSLLSKSSIALTLALAGLLSLYGIQSANAESSIRECISEFIKQGVSPDKAADLCSSGGLAVERCVEKKRYRTFEGTPRNREDGRTEYIYPTNAFDTDRVSGTQCWSDYRNFFNPSNVCWASSIRTTVMSEEKATQECQITSNSGRNPVGNGSSPNGGSTIIVLPGGGTIGGNGSSNSRYREVQPVEGPNYNGWYRYEKPSNISDSAMQEAGARFESGPSACAISGYCLNLNGTWISKQSMLIVQVPSL